MPLNSTNLPLAEQLRPNDLTGFFGQKHLLNTNHPLRRAIDNNNLHSMILWGPSGTGKTTLARIITTKVDAHFENLNAVLDGVKKLRAVVENAKKLQTIGKKTTLFVDEIHRFNKAQQDGFLPHIESGLITLIGATTHNPSFELNRALLSRLSVHILHKLDKEALSQILERTLKSQNFNLDEKSKSLIVDSSDGDARRLINIVEKIDKNKTDNKSISLLLQNNIADFDKGGDIFFQQLSAFHKSVRGSSPDGALYWMARMLDGGCDVKVIARRLLAIASEDIGNADPRALQITLNAWDIFHRLGAIEGNRAIAQAVIYCSVAPKSNAVYTAFNNAKSEAQKTNNLPVPKHLCNAPTKLMQDEGFGEDYRYAHNEKDGVAKGQKYFPDELGEREYYFPTNRGLEIKIGEKLKQLRQKK